MTGLSTRAWAATSRCAATVAAMRCNAAARRLESEVAWIEGCGGADSRRGRDCTSDSGEREAEETDTDPAEGELGIALADDSIGEGGGVGKGNGGTIFGAKGGLGRSNSGGVIAADSAMLVRRAVKNSVTRRSVCRGHGALSGHSTGGHSPAEYRTPGKRPPILSPTSFPKPSPFSFHSLRSMSHSVHGGVRLRLALPRLW